MTEECPTCGTAAVAIHIPGQCPKRGGGLAHEWVKIRNAPDDVCCFCDQRRPTPPKAHVEKEIPVGTPARPLPKRLPGYVPPPADLMCSRFPSLQEHQRHLAGSKWLPLNREEAIRLGYSTADIIDQWPTP